jgi:Zn-finger nucleic acid-binding protein
VSDEKDRLGQALRDRGKVMEDRWAHQHDDELIAKLRERYSKPINCPVCGEKLEPHAAIGVAGMACPMQHGAWLTWTTLEALRARLANAAAAHHEAIGEKLFEAVEHVVENLLRSHPKEVHCPDCGAKLEAQAAIAYGSIGLGGMACPNQHGAWVDHATVEKIRGRLDFENQSSTS